MFLCAILATPLAPAQTQDLQIHVDAAITALLELDSLANTCLNALDDNAPDVNAQQPCTDFLNGVDGDLLAGYLDHCAVLQTWREQYVVRAVTSDQTPISPVTDLQLLTGVDYACSDDALLLRTNHVVNAFSRLQTNGTANRQNASLQRRLGELQFESTLSAERQSLLNVLQQQQVQRQHQSDRQMRQLENELIRQQRQLPPN